MIASDAVAALRDGIIEGRLVGRQNTEKGLAGSTLNLPIRGLSLGAGAMLLISKFV